MVAVTTRLFESVDLVLLATRRDYPPTPGRGRSNTNRCGYVYPPECSCRRPLAEYLAGILSLTTPEEEDHLTAILGKLNLLHDVLKAADTYQPSPPVRQMLRGPPPIALRRKLALSKDTKARNTISDVSSSRSAPKPTPSSKSSAKPIFARSVRPHVTGEGSTANAVITRNIRTSPDYIVISSDDEHASDDTSRAPRAPITQPQRTRNECSDVISLTSSSEAEKEDLPPAVQSRPSRTSPKDVCRDDDVISLTSSNSESEDAPPATQPRPSHSITRGRTPPCHLQSSARTRPVIANVSDTEGLSNRVESSTSNKENNAPRFIDLCALARGSPVVIRRRSGVLQLLKPSRSSPSSSSSDSSDSGASDHEGPMDRLSDIDRRADTPTSERMNGDAGLARTSREVAQNDVRRINDEPPVDPAPFGDDFKFEVFPVTLDRLRDVDPYAKRIAWFLTVKFWYRVSV